MLAAEMTVGELLKDRREARGMTQAGLAAKSGIPIGTLRNYEQGIRVPTLAAAAKLAKALGIPLDQFARCDGLADEPEPPRRGRKSK